MPRRDVRLFTRFGLAIGALALLCASASAATIVFPSNPGLSGQALLTSLSNSEVTFSSQDASNVTITGSDANGGKLTVTTDGSGADFLLLFSSPVASVTVNYPGTTINDPVYDAWVFAYGSMAIGGTPSSVQGLGPGSILYQSALTPQPNFITLGSGTQNNIYAVQIEAKGMGAPSGQTYTQIDMVSYTMVGPGGAAPEPGTYAMIGLGLLGMTLLRRKHCSS
jgi:hypothetical protein